MESTPGPAASPSPVATPTVEQLAAAYLNAATAYNKEGARAWKAFKKSSKNLKAARRYDARLARNHLAFIRAVQAIPWWGDAKPIARRLLSCNNRQYVNVLSASKAKTALEEARYWNLFTRDSSKCSGIANELRLAIGLPPVPID